MQLSKLIVTSLLILSSATALAEGGGERVKQHWASFQMGQQQHVAKTDAMKPTSEKRTVQAPSSNPRLDQQTPKT